MSKPRRFSSNDLQARGECLVDEDGNRVVDLRMDAYDDKAAASELRRYAEWLVKASRWLEEQ
jgi:hypothetical protein